MLAMMAMSEGYEPPYPRNRVSKEYFNILNSGSPPVFMRVSRNENRIVSRIPETRY